MTPESVCTKICIGCICLVFAIMCYQMPEMMHNHTSLLLICISLLFSIVCFQMCVLKPAVYQKAKSHWLHLSHFPPCVLSNASSKLLHLRIHNYALQRFHSVKPIQLVDDWNKNNREYGVFTMRWNLPSGYIITLAALYVLRSNCNQFKYTPQVTGTEKAAVAAITSFHCHNWHLGVYCSSNVWC